MIKSTFNRGCFPTFRSTFNFTLLIALLYISFNTVAINLSQEVESKNISKSVHSTPTEANGEGTNNKLIGSWQLVSGRYLNEHDQWVDYKDLNLVAIKVISNTHFSFTTMQIKEGVTSFWAAASGTYVIESDQYIEYPQLNSFNASSDEAFRFTFALVDNTWHSKRFDSGKLQEIEVWERLD